VCVFSHSFFFAFFMVFFVVCVSFVWSRFNVLISWYQSSSLSFFVCFIFEVQSVASCVHCLLNARLASGGERPGQASGVAKLVEPGGHLGICLNAERPLANPWG
jgi:hypothetical protein